jgi:hypothetical protein
MRRRSLAGALAGAAVAVALVRRRPARRRDRADLYYDDGSMLSLEDGAPDASPLVALAREALRAVAPAP